MKDRIMLKPTVLVAVILFSISGLFAHHNPPESSWEHLGSKNIGRTNDKDVARIDNYTEWFSAIELRTDRQHVDLHRFVVHYEDGSKQDVSFNEDYHLADNGHYVIGLDGKNKAVDRVTIYGSKDRKKKLKGKVEIWGQVGGAITYTRQEAENYNRRYRAYNGFNRGIGFRRGFGACRFYSPRRLYYRY